MSAFRSRLRLLLCLVLLLVSSLSYSQEKQRPFFQAARPLMMGDAYTAYNADFEAVYYNPAGLAQKNKVQFKSFDLESTGSQDMAMFFKDTFRDLQELDTILTKIQDGAGKNYSVGTAFLPQLLVKNFSIGLIGRGFAEGRVGDDRNLSLYSFAELGGYMQMAIGLFGGIVKIGGGVKFLDRAELIQVMTPAEYTESIEFGDAWREGFGVGYDAGIMLTAPVRYLPTLGVAIQDIGNTSFKEQKLLFKNAENDNGPPQPIRQRINAGIGFKIKHGRNVKSFLTAEVKDLKMATQRDRYKTISDYFHAGWELDIRRILYLRAGLNQGRYWTAGIGLHVAGMGLEAGSYGEDVAFDNEEKRRDDRKYVGRILAVFD